MTSESNPSKSDQLHNTLMRGMLGLEFENIG